VKYLQFTPALFILYISCSPKSIVLNTPSISSFYFEKKINKLEKLGDTSLSVYRKIVKLKVQFGFGIILEEGDRLLDNNYNDGIKKYQKAQSIFLEAKETQIMILLAKYPDFENWLKNEKNIKFVDEDIFDLYWLSAAIGGSIKASRGKPMQLIQLPVVGRLLRKSMKLDPKWGKGALYSAMMSYTASRTDLNRMALKDSVDFYYDKAIEYSDSLDASLFVTYAEAIHKPFQEKQEYLDKLNLAVNLDIKSDNYFKMSNYLAKNRAKWLISKTDDYFLE